MTKCVEIFLYTPPIFCIEKSLPGFHIEGGEGRGGGGGGKGRGIIPSQLDPPIMKPGGGGGGGGGPTTRNILSKSQATKEYQLVTIQFS